MPFDIAPTVFAVIGYGASFFFFSKNESSSFIKWQALAISGIAATVSSLLYRLAYGRIVTPTWGEYIL
jgi:hypothetical protein